MSFALLQRFGPLMSLATKRTGDLTDSDMLSVATALGGEKGAALMPLLNKLRDGSPSVPVIDVLGSDQARAMYERLLEQNAEDRSSIFAKCPCCGMLFESDLKG